MARRQISLEQVESLMNHPDQIVESAWRNCVLPMPKHEGCKPALLRAIEVALVWGLRNQGAGLRGETASIFGADWA